MNGWTGNLSVILLVALLFSEQASVNAIPAR